MLRRKMLVVSPDNRLRREVRRTTAATGSTVSFVDTPADATTDNNLIIVDARTPRPPAELLEEVPAERPVIYIVAEDNVVSSLRLLDDPDTTSVMSHGDRFDDDEFIATATKAMKRSIFGLHKYFPWGVTTYSMVVASGEQKSKAIDVILEYASMAGLRGQVRDRIQAVADELMMNALYHAPVDANGKELFAGKTLKELAQRAEVPPIEVAYGSSGRYFGLSVRDGAGSLTRERAVKYLARAQAELVDVEHKIGGAGLGLVTVLRSVSKLVFNLQPGSSTEVIALFDMDLFGKGQVGARSVHVFTAPREDATPMPVDPSKSAVIAASPGLEPLRPPPSRGPWVLAAILLSVVTALGTAVALRYLKGSSATASDCDR
jgi:hypothetical protein